MLYVYIQISKQMFTDFYLEGDVPQIHDADTHVLQHGELLSYTHIQTEQKFGVKQWKWEQKKRGLRSVCTVGAEQGLKLSQ